MISELYDAKGKVALVTGGGRGIGEMAAEALVKMGVKVYIASRNLSTCEQTASRLQRFGLCIPLAADLSSEAGVFALARQMKTLESKLDILVNNSGKTWGADYHDFPYEQWQKVMNVNLASPFTLIQQLTDLLTAAATEQSPSRVINIGSIMGTRIESDRAYSYVASKSALQHITKILAQELASKSINVNAVAPGYFPTKMMAHVMTDATEAERMIAKIPAKRVGLEQDIHGIISFLSTPASNYVTGAIIPVDGGMCVS